MKLLKASALLVVVLLLAASGGGYLWLHASLPALEGEHALDGLAAPVTVERDGLGIPTITGASRADVARALGFVHAQERFFQMDLLRRAGAGELAALLGPALVSTDRTLRPHRFRTRATAALAALDPSERALIDAYAEGVNAGLAGLGARPFEYLALRAEPEPWRPEDTLLVVYAMFFDLQLGDALTHELTNQALARHLPPALAAFLTPGGDRWDAPLVGEAITPPPVPTPEALGGYRPGSPASNNAESLPRPVGEDTPARGSNNWAVSGALTAHGGAMVADDMHLGLRLPNVWFRASLVFPNADGTERRVTGATLPGAPAVIVGSNGALAWGFTNSYGDFADLVRLVPDPERPGRVLTPEGSVALDTLTEVIAVHGGETVRLEVVESPWGPVLQHDEAGAAYAFQWTAHRPEAVDLGLLGLETADTVEDALAVVNRAGVPAQNVVLGDRAGHVAWTIGGRLPRRVGRDGQRPVASTDPNARWRGFLDPSEYPRVVDPENGRIWTANSRVVAGDALARIGLGPYVHGARAQQIRDRLLALDAPVTEADLLAVQLDDRAVFYERWKNLLLGLLDSETVESHPLRAEVRDALTDWSGRADTASVAFRLVRAFRARTSEVVFDALEASVPAALRVTPEPALWQLATERPPHLLPPGYASWDALLLAAADTVAARADADGDGDVDEFTWGAHNRSRIAHPMADALPVFGDALRMPAYALPGDSRMPNAMQPAFGPSQRMVVAPGHEEDGIFHMPGGQAGHPLSPYWGAGHDDWAFGRPSPFLPGPTVWTLTLTPGE